MSISPQLGREHQVDIPEGTISYRDGQLTYAQYAPMAHSLRAKFRATPSQFSLESALMQVASSTVLLRADVSDFDNPMVVGEYDVRIHTQDFASFSPNARPASPRSVA